MGIVLFVSYKMLNHTARKVYDALSQYGQRLAFSITKGDIKRQEEKKHMIAGMQEVFVTVQPECCVERRTHGRDFFAGRRQRERLSRIFRASFPAGVS